MECHNVANELLYQLCNTKAVVPAHQHFCSNFQRRQVQERLKVVCSDGVATATTIFDMEYQFL